MSLEEYQRVQITEFKGLYQRGLTDSCPPDHAPICQNMRFNRKGETQTRYGTSLSFNIGTPVHRMFVATFNHGATTILLTCDGAGNIYRSDTGGVLLNVAGMVDFAAINVYSWCLISPISGTAGGGNNVYIWQGAIGGGDPVPIRQAAGFAPSGSFAAAETGSGNVDIGVHQFAVSFITNTAYTTQPGPVSGGVFTAVTVTSTGGKEIVLTGIPTGPAGTVARQIFVTQADLDLFYYCPNGLINDNTTTTLTVNFYDTDLAVSADYLFDLLERIPAGNYGEIAGMEFYHGRVFFWGGEFCLIRATYAGSAESIDNVAGYVQLPDQFDQNIVYASCILQDILYFAKSFGIFSVTDNGGDPSGWSQVCVDAGVGTVGNLGTINLAQPSLPQNQITLIADFGGFYIFTGSITQPPLSWKVNDLWIQLMNDNAFLGITIAVNPYLKEIYIYFKGVNYLLVADYNDGLDPMSIKWSQHTFPSTLTAIGMAFIQDASTTEYALRLGFGNEVYKLDSTETSDSGTPINSTYSLYYIAPTLGALNIFRFVRGRIVSLVGTTALNIVCSSEDGVLVQTPPGWNILPTPGRDYLREFNFMNEKCSINFAGPNFLLQRVEVFCGARFNMRPQV